MAEEPPPLPDPHRSEDAVIREAGFVILSRPSCGQARWRRGRVVFLHEGALAIARRERQAQLEALEAKHGK